MATGEVAVLATPATTLQPLVTFSGSQCAITESATHRLHTQAELRAVWDRHRGNEDPAEAIRWSDDGVECPTIDFERCEVIVVFSKQNASGGVRVAELLDEPGLRRLRLASITAQTWGSGGRVFRRRYTEYGYLVLPRRNVPVVIEVDGNNVLGGSPVWEEFARL